MHSNLDQSYYNFFYQFLTEVEIRIHSIFNKLSNDIYFYNVIFDNKRIRGKGNFNIEKLWCILKIRMSRSG